MGFSAGVGFLVDTDGNGTNDGKVVTLKKGSNISLSLTGSTLTISGSGSGGSGSMTTVQSAGSQVGGADIVTLNFGSEFGITETSDTLIAVTIDDATTSAKGKASFSSDNFAVSSGAVTIKNGGVILGTETTGDYVATAVAGEGIDVSGATGNVTISGEDATTSNKGIASFSSDNFAVSSGAVTIKAGGVDLTAEVTGVLPIANFATIDEDNMASDSNTHVPTQQSVKAYVDSVASGLDVKDSVRVATTGNITLTNQQTIDGVSVVDGNRVLVKNQSTASQNGIYLCVDGGSWTRATDLAASDTAAGFFTFVEEGTANADIGYVCTSNAGADTVGTHSLAFAQFSSAGQVTAGTLLDKSGSTLNVDLSESSDAVMAEADEFVFLDTGSSSAASRETLSDLLDTIAGTVATTGLDRSGATLVVSDLHPVGVSGSANQLLTDDGDGTVTSESSITFDSPTLTLQANGSGIKINDTTASSATQGGSIRLSSDDGALMATGHRLGVIEFAGAEDGSSTITVGARIEVLCNGAWSASANAADMVFYTTTGNATQGEVMRLMNDKSIATQGGITVQTDASSGQKALYLRHNVVNQYAIEIAGDNTTANVINIAANDVTTATVFNIDSGGVGAMTTGKVIDAKGTYTIADGGTVDSNRLYTTLAGTATQTNTGTLSYVKKVGATASGKTSTATALEAWTNDATTNDASGTSIARGVYGKASFATSNQGTTSTFGGVFEVSGADNNYGVQIIGGSLLLGTLSAAPLDISTYGQLWVKDNGSGSANTELYFTNDNGDDIQITDGSTLAASSLAFTTIAVSGQANVVADSATDTLTFAAGSNIAITTDAGGDQVTIAATGTISGGITVQEEGSALSNLGDTLNFVGSSVTASGTGTTKTITISGGGAFARSTNIIKTTETIGVGGSNVEEFALSDGGAVNSEAIMTNGGTNSSVTTHGMGMRKNVTIVVPDADTGDDTYTVADTDHIIMICNVSPSNSSPNPQQIIRHVQMPAIGTNYVGREITVTLHALTGLPTDNITVKPAADDVILYHGRMWDNNMPAGDHTAVATSTGGDGMTMGHAAAVDVNWASLGQFSVISVTMVAVDHGRLAALLNANPIVHITQDPTRWRTADDTITADVWLVTSVSGVSIATQMTGHGAGLTELGAGFEAFLPTI